MKTKHDAKKSKAKKDNGKDQDSPNLSDTERRQLWVKEVGEDPYVQEGIAVLTDVISENPGLTLNDQPATGAALAPAN